MAVHNEDALHVVESLHSNLTAGLSEEQVQEKRAQYGENKLREKKKKTMFSFLSSL